MYNRRYKIFSETRGKQSGIQHAGVRTDGRAGMQKTSSLVADTISELCTDLIHIIMTLYLHFKWVRKLKSNSLTKTKLLRLLAGYTLYDHKTNDYIRRELRITGILDKIDEYRWNWLSHLQRMPQNRIPLKSHHYRPQGRRTTGRLKKRWWEQL